MVISQLIYIDNPHCLSATENVVDCEAFLPSGEAIKIIRTGYKFDITSPFDVRQLPDKDTTLKVLRFVRNHLPPSCRAVCGIPNRTIGDAQILIIQGKRWEMYSAGLIAFNIIRYGEMQATRLLWAELTQAGFDRNDNTPSTTDIVVPQLSDIKLLE